MIDKHSCHPDNRPIWQAFKEKHGGVECAEEYLSEYVEFASAIPKPTDKQVNDLFEDTKININDIVGQHISEHGDEIAEGLSYYNILNDSYYRKLPDCNIDQEYNEYLKTARCTKGFSRGVRQNIRFVVEHSPCDKIELGYQQDIANCSNSDNQAKCVEDRGINPVSRGMPVSEYIKDSQKVLDMCSKMGCSLDDWERIISTRNIDCLSNTQAKRLTHYFLDKDLKDLKIEAESAVDRFDKVMVIEKFINMEHHRGSVLDMVCRREISMPSMPVDDILNCLAGADWEKL